MVNLASNAASLELDRLSLKVGDFRVRDVTLNLPPGGYGVLLGPTGCGKTLLAEMICGLVRPDGGRVGIGGADVTGLDPARRAIGYVPQDYALLPFLSVARNIAFGLEARRLPAADIAQRVDKMLDLMNLQHLRDRDTRGLSGGERQRTALGRALAIEPALLVLDEPLSALDEATGDAMLETMSAWHRTLGITTLHICHRLEEALALGSQLVVMRDGQIEQAGTPETLATRPANAFVADFLRLPNRLKGYVRQTAQGRWFFIGARPVALTDSAEGPACAMYPMNQMRISREPPAPVEGWNTFETVVGCNRNGWVRPSLVLRGEVDLRVHGAFDPQDWPEESSVYVRMPVTGWHVVPDAYDASTLA